MRKKGKVLKFNTSNGEGTIKSNDNNMVNFTIENVIGKDLPEYGSEVEFEQNGDIAINILVSPTNKEIRNPQNIVISNNNVSPVVVVDNKPSWFSVIIWLFLFFPVGLYLLFKKL